MDHRILIAGIGNIFAGDDAFGVEVIRELTQHPLPEAVFAKDFGIRSYDLAYAMMDGYSTTILVDATSRGQPPGTVYLIEPDVDAINGQTNVDAHCLNPVAVLQLVQALGGKPGKLYLVGCEPEVLDSDEIGLSPSVRAAVPQAVQMIEFLVHRLLNESSNAVSPAGA
ncbi:MAG TPA: hydrogenase maturation protease [Terrimicrobiaceae bacterium]